MTLRSISVLALAGLVAAPAAASAQQASKMQDFGPMVYVQSDGMPARAEFIATELSFDGETVAGAPYSADAVSESVHTLADGNHIVSSSRSKVYRDSEGRTRREQSLSSVGPWAADGAREVVIINDPVAGVNFIVDPDKKTARKLPAARVFVAKAAGAEAAAKRQAETHGDRVVVARTVVASPDGPMRVPLASGSIGAETFELKVAEPKDAKKDSLGTRTIEGVACEGTRSTVTIPAGEIGNERAIDIVSESWYSPELKTVVLSTHSDPRFGETTFKLTNISRAEPDRALFEPPAGMTIVDASTLPARVQMRREVEKKASEQ